MHNFHSKGKQSISSRFNSSLEITKPKKKILKQCSYVTSPRIILIFLPIFQLKWFTFEGMHLCTFCETLPWPSKKIEEFPYHHPVHKQSMHITVGRFLDWNEFRNVYPTNNSSLQWDKLERFYWRLGKYQSHPQDVICLTFLLSTTITAERERDATQHKNIE